MERRPADRSSRLKDVGRSADDQDDIGLKIHQPRRDQGDHLIQAGRDGTEIVDARPRPMGLLQPGLQPPRHGIGEDLSVDQGAVADDEDPQRLR